MANTTLKLTKKGLIDPPPFVPESIQYEVFTGSVAYGSSGAVSDLDINGFCIPPKPIVFPHLAGEIEGFGRQKTRFFQYQQHHIQDPSAQGGKGQEYDITIYNIVKFFQLCMENNPNMIDILFVPRDCVLFSTEIGEMVRTNRSLFVSKLCYHKFRGYAYSQLSKMKGKKSKTRQDLVDKYGYDTKYAYHLIRLLLEAEQLLQNAEMDLRQNGSFLKHIREGAWSFEKIVEWFDTKEKSLEKLYHESKIPYGPPEKELRKLLFKCLESFYGSLENCVVQENQLQEALQVIQRICYENLRS